MRKEKRQSFLHGAVILAVAGILVKVIGACFKIPLGAILKPEGMANFSIAYNIYALLFVLSTAGVPVAVSKMIAEANALGRYREVLRIYRVSYIAFAIIGALCSISMAMFAKPLAALMGSPESSLAIRAIAPAIMFVSVSSINRGYYQGHSNMYPTAVSEVIEALGKLFIGLGAALWLSKIGFGIRMVSAGAVIGVTAGAFFSAAYFLFVRENDIPVEANKNLKKRSKRDILRELLRLAIPITMGAAVISLTNVIDSALVMNLLQKIGYTLRESMWLYGAYTYSANLFNLPSTIVLTISVSLIPSIAATYVRHDLTGLNKTVESALRIAILIAIPASAGMYALAYPLVYLLYGGSIEPAAIEAAAVMLKTLALAVPFLATVTLTNSIHQSMGNVRLPVLSMLTGAAVKLVSNLILVSMPRINIYGAPVSTVICYAVIAFINVFFLMKNTSIRLNLWRVFAKPLLVGILTGIASFAFYNEMSKAAGVRISAILAVAAGMMVCIISVVFTKTLTKNDLELLPRNKKITKFLNIH